MRIIRTGGIEGYHFPTGLPSTPEGGEPPRLPDLATYLFDHAGSGELIEVSRYRDTGVDTRVIRILAVGGDFFVVEEDHQIVLIPIESFNELQVRRIEEP